MLGCWNTPLSAQAGSNEFLEPANRRSLAQRSQQRLFLRKAADGPRTLMALSEGPGHKWEKYMNTQLTKK